MYGKIFAEIFDSSLVQYEGDTIYVFMCMIVLSDADGYVKLDPIALANRIRKPIDVVISAIKNLESPDINSSNPDYNGRRIIPIRELTGGTECRGWWLVSYEKWRNIAKQSDKTYNTRERVKRWRDKQVSSVTVTPCNAMKQKVTPNVEAEAEAEVEVEAEDLRKSSCSKFLKDDISLTQMLIDLMEKNNPNSNIIKGLTPKKQEEWIKSCRLLRERDNHSIEDIQRVIYFSQTDNFWKSNILSMPKLREKWDQLWLKAKRLDKFDGIREWLSQKEKETDESI